VTDEERIEQFLADATDDAAFYVQQFNTEKGGCPLCGGPAIISEGRVRIRHLPGCERDGRRPVKTVAAPVFRSTEP
jgi:hypothetical protein